MTKMPTQIRVSVFGLLEHLRNKRGEFHPFRALIQFIATMQGTSEAELSAVVKLAATNPPAVQKRLSALAIELLRHGSPAVSA